VAHPAWDFCCVAIPWVVYRIYVGGKPGLAHGELIDGSERYPGVVCSLALHRGKQISDYGERDGDSDYSIDEHTKLEEHPAAGYNLGIVLRDLRFFLDEVGHRASSMGVGLAWRRDTQGREPGYEIRYFLIG
jgi:hypothetical protein